MTQVRARVLIKFERNAVLEIPLDGNVGNRLVQVDIDDISNTGLRKGAPIRYLLSDKTMKDYEHAEIEIPAEFIERLQAKIAAMSTAK